MKEYAGSRWYKCDLHLHTMSSICYQEKSDTPQMWIARAMEAGLSVVAVTDHNDYRGIDAMIEEGKKQGITVFPGVEITCDSSKIHILVLFDMNKNSETVREFLNRCDIYSESIGSAEGTNMSVFEICEIAKKRGAIVIASHIDEFNSISKLTPSNIEKILSSQYIDAVQVVNVDVWEQYNKDKNVELMNQTLKDKYGQDATAEEIDRWRKCYDRAIASGIPCVSFSDNPCALNKSGHGLWGIGSSYTWFEMDKDITFESLRQTFVTPERIKTMFQSVNEPQGEPDFWIQSMDITGTKLNPHMPLHLDFHPQLNVIIGGIGSGKSSIINILSGVYYQLTYSLLKNTKTVQEGFYKPEDENGLGVFNKDSKIDIIFKWYGSLYRYHVYDIESIYEQKSSLTIIDPNTKTEKEYPIDDAFYMIMAPKVLVQGQINEIAHSPQALLEQIDSQIAEMYMMQSMKQYYLDQLIYKTMQLHASKQFAVNEKSVEYASDWFVMRQQESDINTDKVGISKSNIDRLYAVDLEMKSCVNSIELIEQEQDELLKKYESVLREIRQARMECIKKTLENNENYKIELLPVSNRSSFHTMLENTLRCDLIMIKEDVRKLEEALFARKNGLRKYREILESIRDSKNKDFSDYFIQSLKALSPIEFGKLCIFHPEDELVLYYQPNGVQKYFPIIGSTSGEKAAFVFTFLLLSQTTPLVVDHPEDTIDSRILYDEVIPKIKRVKQTRQLILVTHSPNIATNADPEMIISMSSKSKFVKVREQGTLESASIREDVCDALEGGKEAFLQRVRKYRLI